MNNSKTAKIITIIASIIIGVALVAMITLAVIPPGKASSIVPEESSTEVVVPGGQNQNNNSTPSSGFSIRFIDVGQGDSTLISCDGHYMIYDGGPSDQSDKIFTILRNQGIEYLDYVIASHNDADHVGGLAGALTQADCGKVYCVTTEGDTVAFEKFQMAVAKRNKQIEVPHVGDEFKLGSATVKVVGPIVEDASTNTSLVIKVTYGEFSLLLTGDTEEPDEKALLSAQADIACTVLKVAHHGSNSSSTPAFLEAAKPQICVISVGKNNTYGHPTQKTLKNLDAIGAQLYRTDLQGEIVITFENGQPIVTTQKNKNIDTYQKDDWK